MNVLDENHDCDLKHLFREYISRTTARCFISSDLNEEFFTLHKKFSKLVNTAMIFSYFLPKSLMKITFKPMIRFYRFTLSKFLLRSVKAYRDDPSKSFHCLIRSAIDFEQANSGQRLSDSEIANILIAFIWIATENTALGLTNVVIDLIENSKYWSLIKEETSVLTEKNNFEEIINSSLLNACIMESARLNTHLMSLCRLPARTNLIIGDENYLIGVADTIAICAPLMHTFECSSALFNDAECYDPLRYFPPRCENFTSKRVMTWGSGIHLCPGKNFALCEIKLAVAFLSKFIDTIKLTRIERKNYFSASAFVDRNAMAEVILKREMK
ncbi:hypothetical protein B4U79_18534 [Dinothrombium tinctorium]|uniref:Lanosterol 14-alpha demethylase n=1 Tax=Dinothrombium tinctorium TaxID=1965070 RepID=A0A3S3RD04_9ACAR|nr:hypothetical protein B4U79_18850 [Dinothrombium tinctorium]RWR99089.1 hypothetical protein B4U79_18832 [Dinothrombium tinctorium]RWS01938.1 hypothetical protein B4U79_18534 [Dinothrombium tinctorium]